MQPKLQNKKAYHILGGGLYNVLSAVFDVPWGVGASEDDTEMIGCS